MESFRENILVNFQHLFIGNTKNKEIYVEDTFFQVIGQGRDGMT